MKKQGEIMEMRHLMKIPKYSKLWGKPYGNALGQLTQGMPGLLKGTKTIMFINR